MTLSELLSGRHSDLCLAPFISTTNFWNVMQMLKSREQEAVSPFPETAFQILKDSFFFFTVSMLYYV